MVTNNHLRALEFALSQTADGEAFTLESPLFGSDQRAWPRGLEMLLMPVYPLLGPAALPPSIRAGAENQGVFSGRW